MRIFRFLSAHKESLWTLTRQRQWPLSFRAFNRSADTRVCANSRKEDEINLYNYFDSAMT